MEIKPGMPAWFYRSSGMNHKAGRTESIDILAEAYENFIDLVNKYGLEMEKENQEINDSLTKAGKGFSLFGWLFKIFS